MQNKRSGMGFKFSKPLKYGIKKKEQSAMKRIMSVKKNLSKQDSINRVERIMEMS